MKIYHSYLFHDKDPIIYEIWDIMKASKKTFAEVADRSGVSAHTLHQWFYGATERPQVATVRAVLRSLGYDTKVARLSTKPQLVINNDLTHERLVKPVRRTAREARLRFRMDKSA